MLEGEGHVSRNLTKLGRYVVVDVGGKYITFFAERFPLKFKKI